MFLHVATWGVALLQCEISRAYTHAYIYKVFWDYEFVAGPFLCAKSF